MENNKEVRLILKRYEKIDISVDPDSKNALREKIDKLVNSRHDVVERAKGT